MKFHLATAAGNVFTGYGDGYVEINKIRYETNVIVTPEQIATDWAPEGFGALTRENFKDLLKLTPEIVLLATGRTIRFPHPRLTADLPAVRVGIEIMDSPAACRTFNVLAAEGRRVVAALLLV